MAYSGTVGATPFNANKVVDTAYRRCRLPAQAITAEMQQYALDALYMLLSNLPNSRVLSWCIERVILPMVTGQPIVALPLGTVDLQNLNYRTVSVLSSTVVTDTTLLYEIDLGQTGYNVSTVKIVYTAFDNLTTGTLYIEGSDDGLSWEEIGSTPAPPLDAEAQGFGRVQWADITPPTNYRYLRLNPRSVFGIFIESFNGCNNPSEVPMGQLNKDTYVAQSNKVFEGRPTTYWFQRDIPRPVVNLWPAPNDAASGQSQLIAWRQRHVMDVSQLRQDVEVPARWLDSIGWMLAFRVAVETPAVSADLIPFLQTQARNAEQIAFDGDSDGAPTYLTPYIAGYTR